MRPIRAGRMRHLITLLERAPGAQDEFGASEETWTPLRTNLAAEIQTGTGRAFEAALQRQQELTHLIIVRVIPGITTRRLSLMRVRIEDEHDEERLLEQLEPPTDRESAGRELTFTCREILNDHDR